MLVSALMFVALGVASLVTSAYMFFSNRRTGSKASHDYFILFLFFSLFSFFIGIPLLFFIDNLEVAARGYALAIAMLVVIFILTTRTQTFSTNMFAKRYKTHISVILAVLGSIFVAIALYNPQVPDIDNSFYIQWNLNPIVGWGMGLMSFAFSILWAYINYQNAKLVDERMLKIKSLSFALNGLFWGTAALLYFPLNSMVVAMVTFILILVPLLFSAVVFWVSRLYRQEPQGMNNDN